MCLSVRPSVRPPSAFSWRVVFVKVVSFQFKTWFVDTLNRELLLFYEMDYYLSHPDRNVRLILTKFRLSDHKLLIAIGRYLKIPRDQRLCAICNVLEDEFHFFFECKRNTNNRNILYQYFQNIHFIPILSKYIFKLFWIKPWREINKNT